MAVIRGLPANWIKTMVWGASRILYALTVKGRLWPLDELNQTQEERPKLTKATNGFMAFSLSWVQHNLASGHKRPLMAFPEGWCDAVGQVYNRHQTYSKPNRSEPSFLRFLRFLRSVPLSSCSAVFLRSKAVQVFLKPFLRLLQSGTHDLRSYVLSTFQSSLRRPNFLRDKSYKAYCTVY